MPLSPWISKQLAEFSPHNAGFRELCERVPVGIFLADLEDHCVYANPTACAIVGLAPDEAIDLGWMRYIHPDDGQRALAAWEAAVAASSDFFMECRYDLPDRGQVWARSHAVPWHDAAGDVIGYLGSIQDITEQRRAEAALSEKERLFRTIFQQAGVGVGVLDSRTGKFVRVNQKYCDLVGYTHDEMLQRSFQSLTHPDDLPHNEGTLREMHAGRLHTFSIEKRYVRKDGEIVWVNVTITPLWNPGEPPDLHITIVEDITQRKLAEQKVRQSEERFRRLCEHAPVGIFLCDAQGQAVYINPRGCAMVGITPQQALRGEWTIHMHPDDRQRVSDLWRQAVAAKLPYANESRYVHPGGESRRTFTKAIATFDERGDVVGWIGVILDVTEERQALEALRASEQQYRALFNATTDAIILSTLDGRLVDVNPAACAMHGYTREEFLQLDIHDFIHPESHPLFGEYLETCRSGGLFHCEAQNIRRDGTAFDIEVHGSRLVYRGEPHAFAIIRDISQRKAADAELRRQEEMLAHVSRLSTMGEMAAGIAHEVNQPLYSILNYAKAAGNVLADVDGPQMDDVRHWHDEIAAAAARAGDIVRRLRDFTRRTPASQRPEDLNLIVRESLGLVQHELRRAEIDVDLQLAADLPPVSVDHVQIQQVLVNLVKNAIEALCGRPPAERELHITTRRAGERVFVDVADNGPGLPPAARGNPFDPFVTTKAEGMGLGLPISRTIVEAHGGAIAAQANARGGATFTFQLPAATTTHP